MRNTFDLFSPHARGRFGDHEAANVNAPRVTGASDLLDFTLELREDRPVSIAVTDPAKPGGKWIWLPKSQIEYAHARGGCVEVTIPSWLARDKGLV